MDKSFTIRVPSDNDGLVSLVCSLCHNRFKLTAADLQADDVLRIYCPACGIQGSLTEFLPKEVFQAARRIVENEVAKMINDFGRNLEQTFSGVKGIKVTKAKDVPMQGDKVLSEENDLEMMTVKCCRRDMKVSLVRKVGTGYCPFCGVHRL